VGPRDAAAVTPAGSIIGLHRPRRNTVVARPCPPVGRVVVSLLSALFAAPAYADARGDARKQVEFGIAVAQRGLWREAIYRWQRATEIDPTYAQAFNNLAIAHEQQGELDKARAAYEKAAALEPNNPLIRQNFDLFKEINDRTGRTDGR
jgi:tetratricopeptide (TPR) repeat protein